MKNIFVAVALLISQLLPGQNVMWFNKPASDWNSALPVGNGRIGAMVYGRPWSEIIQLNEESLWAGCPEDGNADASAYLPEIQRLLLDGKVAEAMALSEEHLAGDPLRIRSYQTFGEISIRFFDSAPSGADNPAEYRRDLDLRTGIASTSFSWNGVKYSREVFTSAVDDVLIIRMTADKPGTLTFNLSYNRQKDAYAHPVSRDELEICGQIIDLPSAGAGDPGAHMKFGGLIKGIAKGGRLETVNNSIFVENADEVTFYVAMNTDYSFEKLSFDRNIDPSVLCHRHLDALKDVSFSELRSRHVSDHSALFDRVSLSLGDPGRNSIPTDERLQALKEGTSDPALVALYFQFGRYLLMGSSRRPGRLPANLQGIWCEAIDAPWNSDFHTNINIQMNYWPAEVCNLSEAVGPFSDWIDKMRGPGRVTARKTFNAKGWTINHVSNPFGHTSISDGVGWGTFPIAAAWLVLHQWEHYQFTGDSEYLREVAYPSMKEAAEFLLSFMIEDKHGYLVTAPSNSPENKYRLPDGSAFNLTYGATMDVEITMELFNACITASQRLGEDKPFRKELQSALKKLPPIKVSERYGTIQEWIEDYEETEPGHRHISHLFGLFPGTVINPDTAELFQAAKRTVERRRRYNEDPETRQGSYTGWSRAWVINFYARLQNGEEAGANVNALLSKSTLPNLFDTHPPFQIDGNFGGTAGIAEMLLQSHTGDIRILPALPSEWKDGEVKGLRARGGYTVDIKWTDGTLEYVRVVPDNDCNCVLRYGDKTKKIRMSKGEDYLLTSF